MSGGILVRPERGFLVVYERSSQGIRYIPLDGGVSPEIVSLLLTDPERAFMLHGAQAREIESSYPFLGKGEAIWIEPRGSMPDGIIGVPVRLYFDVTSLCQCNCRYCMKDTGGHEGHELTSDECIRIVETAADDGILEIRVSGGEPLLKPGWEDVLRAVLERNLGLSVNSNLGHGESRILRLAELRPDIVVTSMEPTGSLMRSERTARSAQVIENIRLLKDHGITVRVNMMITRRSLPHLESFLPFVFGELDADVCLIAERCVGRAADGFDPVPLDELVRVIPRLDAMAREEFPHRGYQTSFKVMPSEVLEMGSVRLAGTCGACVTGFNVDEMGRILPCNFLGAFDLDRFTLGQVRDEEDYSVVRVWRESPMLYELRRLSAATQERCLSCRHHGDDCFSSCLFERVVSETTGRPDPYCLVSQRSRAGRVESREEVRHV